MRDKRRFVIQFKERLNLPEIAHICQLYSLQVTLVYHLQRENMEKCAGLQGRLYHYDITGFIPQIAGWIYSMYSMGTGRNFHVLHLINLSVLQLTHRCSTYE